ncbi:flagellar biosynthetic protein FliO [Noviherbaspirillum massiliense]|uniref:flagellar biosynthetic protein FliO n=1 Tax=Noviherbaspirillum massiliense TaxID=1465823 RepID=UPI0002F76A1B|nr:flagellar biosynthetic protein FliO [Noviherbaspirillum massiliense]
MMARALLVAALAGANAAAFAAQPSAATTVSTASTAGSLFQVLLGLGVVLGLMAGAAWLLRRLGMARGPGAGVARIVGGVSVGNRERVMVVEVADQWIVVGVAPGRVNALSTMPRQEQPVQTSNAQASGNFAAWLRQSIDKRNGG